MCASKSCDRPRRLNAGPLEFVGADPIDEVSFGDADFTKFAASIDGSEASTRASTADLSPGRRGISRASSVEADPGLADVDSQTPRGPQTPAIDVGGGLWMGGAWNLDEDSFRDLN